MNYIAKQGKSYTDINEYQKRKENFEKSEEFVTNFNKRTDVSFKVGLNNFSDWSSEEIKKLTPADPGKLEEEPMKMD